MDAPPFKKRPRLESEPENAETDSGDTEEQTVSDGEEDLVALIEHRSKEVEHLRKRFSYYKSQLEEAEKRLDESQRKLARLRGQNSVKTSLTQSEFRSQFNLNTSITVQSQPQSKLQPEILDIKQEDCEPVTKSSCSPSSAGDSGFCFSNSMIKLKGDKTQREPCEKEVVDAQDKGAKRISDQKRQKDLIPMISCHSSPCMIDCQTCAIVTSQHKRKLRSLVLSPTNEQHFATSALDGVVNLWQLQGRGSSATLLSSTNCLSAKQRRWPEDIAWHPEGNSLFSVYSADGEESQISILNLNKQKVSFLEEKPHVKGIINNIMFMPWEDNCFVTGGSDHAVIFWSEKERENSWKPKVLHKSVHSSAVMGVAGMQQKKIVMSAGADKRIIGFDLVEEKVEYKHQIESKCMSVLPNPRDLNLFMVQTGTLEKQLRLFDIRDRQKEVHLLGWKQESSESQSALIHQAWSPNGLYISSGSVDPVIHIFDIRYNSHKPSQSIKAHQKRVFKAVWHPTLPLLISISSDLNIGLHETA
nr:U5 small nuclear ribonucleoprotein [Ipomoea batatas]